MCHGLEFGCVMTRCVRRKRPAEWESVGERGRSSCAHENFLDDDHKGEEGSVGIANRGNGDGSGIGMMRETGLIREDRGLEDISDRKEE